MILHPWTPAEDEILRRFWAGSYSAGQIAALLRGRTRSSVIGRVHRLGIKRSVTEPEGTKPRSRPLRPLEDALRRQRANEQRANWEALRISREPCVGCGVPEDRHDEAGCVRFLARRIA